MRRSPLIAAVSLLVLVAAAGDALAQDAADLNIGASVEGELTTQDPIGDSDGEDGRYRYDDYRFTARAGQRLEAILNSKAFDAYLEVFADGAADGEPIGTDDDGVGEGTNSRLLFTPEADGIYVLRARALSGLDGGPYALSLSERPPAPQAPEPGRISVGGEVTGTLAETDPETDEGDRYDAYRFEAAAGDRLAIQLDAVDESEDAMDPLVRVGRMEGGVFSELAMNDDTDGLNSYVLFTAPDAGEYVIRAEALNGRTGEYTLSLAEGPEAAAAQPIEIGGTVQGELGETDGVTAAGQRADLYRFTGRAGQRIAVEMSSTAFDTYLTLYGDGTATGTALAEDDDGQGDGTDSLLTHTLSADGDYVIEARSLSGDQTGGYRLELSEVAPEPAPTPLAMGAKVQGEIADTDPQDDEGRRFDAYAFFGTEGNRVQIVMRSGDFDTFLQLGRTGEAFEVIVSDDDGLGEGTDSRLTHVLPATGDYVLRALPLSSELSGLYSLELIDRGPQPTAGNVQIGATARGALTEADAVAENGAYFDAYRMQAKAGDKLRITMVSNEFDAFLDIGSQGEGDDATFTSIKTDDDGLSDTHAKVEWTVEDDGTYVIRAKGLTGTELGTYALIVDRDR